MAAIVATGSNSGDVAEPSAGQSRSSKLHVAAQQFEALMIGEMLKAAHSDDSDDPLGTGEDSGGDSMMEMAQSQLSTALAAHGGFGLAAMVERSMSRGNSSTQQATETVGSKPAPSTK